MNGSNLTIRANQALQQAQRTAAEAGNPTVGPLHLLSALLNEEAGGIVVPLLQKLGDQVAHVPEGGREGEPACLPGRPVIRAP